MLFDSHAGYSEPVPVTTVQGGQSGICFPLKPVYDAAKVKYMRVNLHLQSLSVAATNMIVEAALQTSVDGVTWPASTATPTSFATPVTRNQEGVTNITAFEDVSSLLSAPYFRVVLLVKNTAGNSGLGTCLASVRVERKSC
jgi:hypothetical protein